jgi:hypothetical protein
MQLTLRDGAATVLAALVIAVLLAVTQAWSWPLLGDYRSGVVALTILGFTMCTVGLQVVPGQAAESFRRPLMIAGSVLGVTALVLVVAGLIFATEALFVALAFVLLALWVATTVDHALPGIQGRPLRSGA